MPFVPTLLSFDPAIPGNFSIGLNSNICTIQAEPTGIGSEVKCTAYFTNGQTMEKTFASPAAAKQFFEDGS